MPIGFPEFLQALRCSWLRGLAKRAHHGSAGRGKRNVIAAESLEQRLVLAEDFGDAPDTGAGTGTGNYNTLLGDNGPHHTAVSGLRLGAAVGGESDASQNSTASGDDIGTDDEDGVVNPVANLQFTIGTQPEITLRATNTTGTAGALYGWIDYNTNGVFDNATERASVSVPTGTTGGLFTLTFPTVPAGFTGTTFARFRLSTDVAAANSTGSASDGEVEDYAVTIVAASNGKPKLNSVTKIANGVNGGPSLANQARFGSAVASLGDLDGDGIGDIAVGSSFSESSYFRGAVYIEFLNADGSVKASTRIGNGAGGGPTLVEDENFGSAIANLGDIDGDGHVDIAVGAYGFDGAGLSRGAVYILRLNSDGTVKSGGSTKITDVVNGGPTLANFALFGSSVANLGDIDGDGMVDIAVGASLESTEGSQRGAVYILRLNTDGTVKSGGISRIASSVSGGPTLADRDQFGASVTSLGDFDGDGIGDLAVGAYGDATSGTRSGAVYILRLNADGTVKTSGITKIASGTNGGPTLVSRDYFGTSVANAGDIDGDGVTDLLVGAHGNDTGGTARGASYVLRLNADGTVKTNGITMLANNLNGGPTLGDNNRFGSSATLLGDFDGDGVVDLLVGADGDTNGGSNVGAIYILRLDVPATPTAILPSATTIAENQPSGTTIGTLSTTDANPYDTFAYSFATGTGDTDNAAFQIVGNVLKSNAVFDYETQNSYSIRLKTTDDSGLSFEQIITINVTNVTEYDYGDAPDTGSGTGAGNYETQLANGGPRHDLRAGLRLGSTIDASADATANATASGDDLVGTNAIDDEDGVVSPLATLQFTIGTQPTITLRATNTTGTAAVLYGWIDYNNNGVFDNATERASVSVPTGTNNGTLTLTFPTVPAGFTGTTYARFRLSTDVAAANSTGTASDGEIEDYAVAIVTASNDKVKQNGVVRIASGVGGGPTLPFDNEFGEAVAAIGDIDGDGIVDLAVGDLTDSGGGSLRGAVYILRLNVDGTVKAGGITKISNNSSGGPALPNVSLFGASIAAAGDIDGDGIGDLAVGAPGDGTGGTYRGAVYLLRLNADGTVKSSTKIANNTNDGPILADRDFFGASVAAMGDLDGDGVGDLAIGAQGDDTGGNSLSQFGAVYIVRLNADGTVKSSGITKIANATNGGPALSSASYFGKSLTALGDIDGDGVVDLAVGASGDDTGGSDRGAVFVLRMNADGSVKSATKVANNTGGGPALANVDLLGRSVASPGDLDGDGIPDLAVGAIGDDAGGTNRGAVYLLHLNADGTVQSGKTTKIAYGTNGGPTAATMSAFGGALARIGDRDGDGVADLVVGAYGTGFGGNFTGEVYLLHLDRPVAPTALSLTPMTIAENEPAATPVGTFATTDANAFDTFTYTFATGTGDTDNAAFQIVGSELRSNATFNFEVKSSYSIRVRTTDDSGRWFEQTFTINVTDVNEAPTAVALQNVTTTLAESTSTATAIKLADIAVTDDALGTNTLSVSGADAAFFEIVGTELRLKANTVLNFEVKSSYQVTIRVDDTTVGATPDLTTNYTLTVSDVNEPPTAVALQNVTTSLAENTSTATAIKLAEIAVTDDALGTNTLTVSGADAAFFEIVGTELRLKANTVLNFEAKSTYSVSVNVDDPTVGASPDASVNYTLTITNVNESPTALVLNPQSLLENQPVGTVVGSFTTSDPDAGGTFTYTLVTGAGDADNASFQIVGNQLQSKSVFNFEARSSYSVRVRTTDQDGLSFEQSFPISVTNVNEPPVNLGLTATRLTELLPAGTFVGTLSSTDPDGSGPVTYTVVNGAPFEVISGSTLVTTSPINVYQTPTVSIVIRATDAGGASSEATFTLRIDEVVRAFRAYNVGLDAHFFTTNHDEFAAAVAAGYRDEATNQPGFAVLVAADVPASAPLYRLYNLATGRHYYTMSLGEARDLESYYPPPAEGPDTRRNGWRFEGTVGQLFDTPQIGTVEIFRLYNSFNGGHLFTTNIAERDAALAIVDQATGIKPWSQHKSLGFAYFSDPSMGSGSRTGSPSSSVAVAPTQASLAADARTSTSRTVSDSAPLFAGLTPGPLSQVASLIGSNESSATIASDSEPVTILADEPAASPSAITAQSQPAVSATDLDGLFSHLGDLTEQLTPLAG